MFLLTIIKFFQVLKATIYTYENTKQHPTSVRVETLVKYAMLSVNGEIITHQIYKKMSFDDTILMV